MSKPNKGIKLLVLSVIGLLGLTACGESSEEIYSKPSNYDDPIVSFKEGSEEVTDLQNNVLSIIYDAMHDGSVTTKTLNQIMYRYAESVFGVYNSVTLEGREEITLKDAYDSYTKQNSTTKINEFIKTHKVYWNKDENGKHVNDEGTEVDDSGDWTPCTAEREAVVAKWESSIEKRIAESMYGKVASGSYTSKNFFSEKQFLKALHKDGQKVKFSYADDEDKMIIPYTVEEDEIFESFKDFNGDEKTALHREKYQDSYNKADGEAAVYTYIEDEIIPDVYNDLLIEQYLLDEDVAAVRNSRARKINVIKIEKYSSFTNNATKLKDALVDEIYATLPDASATSVRTDAKEIEEAGDALFEKYEMISKGLYKDIQADESAKNIVDKLNSDMSLIYQSVTPEVNGEVRDDLTYYKNTTYGDLVEDYIDVLENADDWNTLDSSDYSKFTSAGTRTVEEGFEQQLIDIMQAKSITKGWYIQSEQPTFDSNGKINDRLFKLSVANAKIEVGEEGAVQAETRNKAMAELAKADRVVKENGVWKVRDAKSEDEKNRFLCSINGAYYLKFEGQSVGEDWKDDIVYDDGNAYYIVQVLEAVKDSKLRNLTNDNYVETRGQAVMNDFTDQVAKLVGETGSYASLSKEHWLEKMDLTFHDQKIYDYFLTTYPDLFD